MNNKIRILLSLYGTYYPIIVDTDVLLKALRKLPLDMQLPPKLQMTALGVAPVERKVGGRIKQLEREQQVLQERIKAIKEELIATPGGEEALKNWEWEPPKV